jgi:T5SS/PEP-CTERM-associated repeat protein
VIGAEAGSTGLIEVDDASLSATGALIVGRIGSGTLAVKNGSIVKGGNLFIGSTPLGNGRVTVQSLGELQVDGILRVGEIGFGDGRLTVDGGSVEQISAESTEFSRIGTTGVIDILNGHFHDRHVLAVNGTLAIDHINGSASVGVNKIQSPGQLTVGPGGMLAGTGTIRGNLTVLPGGVDQFGGAIFTGNSPGTLTIDGDYEQIGGLLGIEIGGTAPGQFDVLAVTGSATVGGTLLLEFIDGFAPRQGDEFKFLDIGGAMSGEFANIDVRGLRPGFQFNLRPDIDGLTMVALNDGAPVPEPATLAMLLAAVLSTRFRPRGPIAAVEWHFSWA